MTEPPVLTTARLRLEALTEADVPALAAILADPDVTKNITADGSTPERCRESAAARIARHNRAWAERGYGVLAVKTAGVEAIPDGTFIGWCGFATLDLGHAVDDVERAFCDAARSRREYAGVARSDLEARVKSAFRSGMSEPHLDWYHLKREDWLAM